MRQLVLHSARKGAGGILAGQASLRKAVFELDPKGSARFLQAG